MKFIQRFFPKNDSPRSEPAASGRPQGASGPDLSPDRVVAAYQALKRAGKPVPGIIHDQMGNMARDLGELESALSHFEQAALAYVGVQSWTDAERVVRKVEDVFGPHSVTPRLMLALLEVALGREAFAEASQVLERLGTTLKPSEGTLIEAAVEAVRRFPTIDPSVDFALAEMLCELGRFDRAEVVLRQALAVARRRGDMELARAIEEKLGSVDEGTESGPQSLTLTSPRTGLPPIAEPVKEPEPRLVRPPLADRVEPSVPAVSEPGALPAEEIIRPAASATTPVDDLRMRGEDPRSEERGDAEVVAELVRQLKEGLAEVEGGMDEDTAYDLGLAFLEMDLYEEAIEQFQVVFRSQVHRLRAVEGLARAFFGRGDDLLAAQLLDQALSTVDEKAPQAVGLLYWRARVHERRGEKDAARDKYMHIVLYDSRYEDAAERLRGLSG